MKGGHGYTSMIDGVGVGVVGDVCIGVGVCLGLVGVKGGYSLLMTRKRFLCRQDYKSASN